MPLALIRRLVKGSPLTATEHDTNLNVLEAGIAASLQPGQAIPSDVECRNNSGVGLTAGAPVYIISSSGTKPTVALADASSESTAARSLGLVVATVSNNADCVVRTHGILTGVNTATLTEGLAVWLSETTGQLTSTRPTQPAHGVFFGFCVKQAAGTAGILYISVINGLELNELHDVLLTGAATDDVLALASDGLWKKRTLGSAAAAATTDFAPAAQGVTNGNSHNHDGGDGAQIAYSSLSGLPTLGGAAALNVGTTSGTVAAGDDSRFSDTREWSAATVEQAEAEAGTATTRRAWTAERVRQAIAAWWTGTRTAPGAIGGTTPSTGRFTEVGLGVPPRTGYAAALGSNVLSRAQIVTVVGSTYTCDIRAANRFILSPAITGNVTIEFSNFSDLVATSGFVEYVEVEIDFRYTSGVITILAPGFATKWDGNTAAVPTAGEYEKLIVQITPAAMGTPFTTPTVYVAPMRGNT